MASQDELHGAPAVSLRDGMGQVPTLLAGAEVVLTGAATSELGSAVQITAGDGTTVTVPRVAAFEVAPDGCRVHVRLAPDADPDLVAGWLFGAVAALVLAHRGRFALHAGAVRFGGSCVAVTGPSGAGKSTTSLQLAMRGHELLTDEVSPVRLLEGVPMLEPFGRPVHVWPDTAQALGLELVGARPLWAGAQKLSLPTPESGPTPLRAVVLLEPGPVPTPALERLRGADAVAALAANVYRHQLVTSRWPAGVLAWAAALAETVQVHRCTRPADRWSAPEVADALLEHVV